METIFSLSELVLINQTIHPLHSPSLVKTFNIYYFQIFSSLIKTTKLQKSPSSIVN